VTPTRVGKKEIFNVIKCGRLQLPSIKSIGSTPVTKNMRRKGKVNRKTILKNLRKGRKENFQKSLKSSEPCPPR
jgi:hypothetical protein